MSKLIVEVCKIDKMISHPNADRLSIAVIKGWNCVVGLDQYDVGDLVVFVPPDSIIPESLIEQYKLTYLKNGAKVGTAKIRGVVSQGLVLNVPEGNYKVGDDVAYVLGITKYEPQEPSYFKTANKMSTKKKINPFFDKYTDIENIKNYNSVFTNGDMVVVTEKLHGSNWRAGNLPIEINSNQPFFYRVKKWIEKKFLGKTHEFVYGSHNVQLYGNTNNNYYGNDIWGKIAEKYHMKDIIPQGYIIYGEIYGKGVQDLTYGMNDIDLAVFDVKKDGKYLDYADVVDFCKNYGLKMVPELYVGEYYDNLLSDFTDGKSSICSTQIREGCVVKSLKEENHYRIGRKVLKSVSAEYLTRKNGTEYH